MLKINSQFKKYRENRPEVPNTLRGKFFRLMISSLIPEKTTSNPRKMQKYIMFSAFAALT